MTRTCFGFRTLPWTALLVLCVPAAADQPVSLNYQREMFGAMPASLSLNFTSVDPATGSVVLNGSDWRQPTTPFTFDWGDGQITSGFFPQQHHYTQVKNYMLTVTPKYGSGTSEGVQAAVRMTAPSIQPVTLPAGLDVTIATSGALPISRISYSLPTTLASFAAGDFGVLPRGTIEYILSVVAAVEKDMLGDTLGLVNGAFRQQVWKDTGGGYYSLWFTNPVSFAAGNQGFRGSILWSSLAHEMGHNFTLNFPAGYIFGGKVDGSGNAIYTETMAQIFQHAALYEVVNNAASYGLSSELAFDLAQDAHATASVVRRYYDSYVSSGKPFATWNNPATPADETLGTFMTVAYEFLSNVERNGGGYRGPVKRLTTFLKRFNSDWQSRYAPSQNTSQADTFRATLMAAAVSYAVGRDLRTDFRSLGFPVDDATFNSLNSGAETLAISSVNTAGGGPDLAPNTWIEIKGKNLVPAGTPAAGLTWSNAPEFASGRMPVQLNGVRVDINGKPAYVYFQCSAVTSTVCAADQINALTPLDSTAGPVAITVINGANATTVFAGNRRAVAPAFLLLNPDGYMVATHGDSTLVGPASLYPGYSTPARPGEQIVLYGVGFGLPSAALVESSSNQSGGLPSPVVCQVGGADAPVAFAGLISPGLYQLNVVIPNTAANGDNAVSCSYSGAKTPAGDVIAVER
ncbi:MAG: hypothetical protein LAP38_20710 [Acidobacteriia bacterium]|nr:hypothetical protein [Terriglobia bacterium]